MKLLLKSFKAYSSRQSRPLSWSVNFSAKLKRTYRNGEAFRGIVHQ
jgi:hypothetical protein